MFKHKKHLFFDLDHTLWDYETSSDETLRELWHQYKLDEKGIDVDRFLQKFSEVNGRLWDRFHAGEIEKDVIRTVRFPAIFADLQVDDQQAAEAMQQDYIYSCPTKPYLIPGALEVLEALAGRYQLHIITNGFEEIQGTKMRSGGIEQFFEVVVTSGMAGSQKPEREIFAYALRKAKARPEESLMIGDNPHSDIEGAYRAGIDQVFYNPHNLECPITPTLEVKSLTEILRYF